MEPARPALTPSAHVDPVPPGQSRIPIKPMQPRLSRPTLCDSIIFVVQSAILIKRQLFFSFGSHFATLLLYCSVILATVLNHSYYNAQLF
jgi:hypothetical protein